jgi:hypothetical protein
MQRAGSSLMFVLTVRRCHRSLRLLDAEVFAQHGDIVTVAFTELVSSVVLYGELRPLAPNCQAVDLTMTG